MGSPLRRENISIEGAFTEQIDLLHSISDGPDDASVDVMGSPNPRIRSVAARTIAKRS